MAKGRGPQSGHVPPGQQAANAAELLNAINGLAHGVISLAEQLPELIDKLEMVSTQFSVLIAAEAERRNQPVQNMVQGLLANLGERAFGGPNRRRRG